VSAAAATARVLCQNVVALILALVANLAFVTSAAAQTNLYFIHTDHLNTPRLIADAAGTTVWRNDNTEPFGTNPPDENPSALGVFEFPLGFTGQYLDKETGNWYNGFRDYASYLGRYVESDPIGLKGGTNTYAYVRADPLRKIDPAGLFETPVIEPPTKPPQTRPPSGMGGGGDCYNVGDPIILASRGGFFGFFRTVLVTCFYYCPPPFCPAYPDAYTYPKTEEALQVAPWLSPCLPRRPRSDLF
jgi:RHS repeat-associated protein